MTTRGFYSVVAHRTLPAEVLVRTRTRADLEALEELIGPIDIFATPRADYPWRAVVSRERWSAAAVLLTAEIDYEDFKTAVAERQGDAREAVYHDVWMTLRRGLPGSAAPAAAPERAGPPPERFPGTPAERSCAAG
ncbi:MAG: hypothetical protein IRZ32_11585 [Solirubrobacteraceae bacterium]|nr:hypothetical protein [Solirubrobacteraceae bacterium]